MNTGLISIRYAKALYAFADERERADKVYRLAKTLSESFAREPLLRRVLANPVLSRREKMRLIWIAGGMEKKETPEFDRFLKLLFGNNREEFLHPVCISYIGLYRRKKNINYGSLISATPIDAETEAKIRALVLSRTRGSVEFKTEVDPALIGGFVIEMNSYRLDASLRRGLKKIETSLTEKELR